MMIANDNIGVAGQSSTFPNRLVRNWGRYIRPWFASVSAEDKRYIRTKSTGTMSMPNVIRLEINTEKICQLVQEHLVCATDFRCMDCLSKECMRQLFLKTCSTRLVQSNPVDNELNE